MSSFQRVAVPTAVPDGVGRVGGHGPHRVRRGDGRVLAASADRRDRRLPLRVRQRPHPDGRPRHGVALHRGVQPLLPHPRRRHRRLSTAERSQVAIHVSFDHFNIFQVTLTLF